MINAVIGHLVGDYLVQNDWMAKNKKSVSWICAVHCLTWTLCVAIFSGHWAPWWLAGLFVTHFAQDRTQLVLQWMRFNGQAAFAKDLAPWSIIVVDNVLHIVTIYVLWHSHGWPT